MKKFIFSLFLVLGIFNISEASITTVPEGEQGAGGVIEIACDTGTNVEFYTQTGGFFGDALCGSSTSIDAPRGYYMVECLNSSCGGVSLASARLSPNYVSEIFYKINPSEQTTQAIPKSIFYARDPETEQSTASNLTAMVGDATGETFASIGPVLAITGGIILAFGIILYIKSLFDEAKEKKQDNTRL